MRKLTLTLALAALLLPGLSLAGLSLAETTEAPKTPDLSLEEILLGDACPKETSLWSPPGCAKPCKTDLNCPHYPEQVCLNGCCVF